MSISTWNADTSYGADTIADNVQSDPLLTSTRYLKKSSPCIDAGVTISGITDEYYGSAVDIGAFEYDRRCGGLAGGLRLGAYGKKNHTWTNLARYNGGFENGNLDDYHLVNDTATIAVDSNKSCSGNYSCKMVQDGSHVNASTMFKTFPLENGESYTLTVKFYAESGNYGSINLMHYTTNNIDTVEGNGGWQKLTATITATSHSSDGYVLLYSNDGSHATNTVYYDDIRLEKN